MAYDQILLGALLAVFLSTFIATLVVVRRRGYDPKGVIGEHVGGGYRYIRSLLIVVGSSVVLHL